MFISLLHSFITKISVALARALDFIKDINDGKELWKFAVRLEDIWKTGIGKGEHLEFIILDKQGDNIHVVLPSDLCPLFESKLEEGATYIMKNFKVQPNDLKIWSAPCVFVLGSCSSTVFVFVYTWGSSVSCYFRSRSSCSSVFVFLLLQALLFSFSFFFLCFCALSRCHFLAIGGSGGGSAGGAVFRWVWGFSVRIQWLVWSWFCGGEIRRGGGDGWRC
ncbi:hypothetical protein QL285_070521 [Trifolium repens]|nr:hypothetical protein QL285_070521 [Trifolium repens]